MKIAITGKGGAGKTTIAATLARTLARRGYRVIAVDADPSPNLAVALGTPQSEIEKLRPITPELVSQTTDRSEIRHTCAATAPDGVELLLGAQIRAAGAG